MNTYVTGSTVKQLREKRNMTQAELAEKIGVSSKTISKWETAKGLPDISLLQPLSQALGISVIELMNGEHIINKNVSANMLRSKFYDPGFNMKIAKFAHEQGIPVHYYIAPKVWAWKEHRVKAIRRYVDKLYIIFPFEKEYFRSKGIEPHFEGNPLVDAIAERCRRAPSREAFFKENGLDSRPKVALLAGSRVSEIKANLRFMALLSERFPDKEFVVAGVEWIDRSVYEKFTAGTSVKFVCDRTYELLMHSEAAVVTSGTATLETALIGIPELVVFGIPWFYEKMMPYVVKIPYVSLVNINLNREAVREMVVYHPSVDEAEVELRKIIEGGAERERMLRDFDELRAIIGGEGASDRFAAAMVSELKK